MALRPKLNRVWTSNNSVARRDPGDAKYLQGWVAEIPTYQVLNYLQYKVDTTMLAQAERGIFEWGSDVSYGVGSLAWDETNKTIYVCTVTNPSKTLVPSANPSQWSPSAIQVSRANYDSVVSAINTHIANRANPHQVTAAQVGTYNRAEMDSLVASYRALVQAHVTDYNNPHKLTAVQVGAVPVTGGTYTGPVTMPTAYFNESKTAQILRGDGLWLKNGNYLIGINDTTGFAETGTTSSKSKIVTELTFPDLKAAQEPEYACLEPTFQMNLISSINIIRGPGTIQNASNMSPLFDQNLGGAFTYDATGTVSSEVYTGSTSVIGGAAYTIAFDYFYDSISTADGWQFTIGLAASRVLVRVNGTLSIETTLAAGGSAQYATSSGLVAGAWNRIVATSDGTNYKLYLNGVLLKEQVGTPMANTLDTYRRVLINLSGGRDRKTTLRAFRIWPIVLSAKQISTL